MPGRPLVVHIGASKTGTSAFQNGLFASADELARQGIALPLTSRTDHIRALLRPLGWKTSEGFVKGVRPERLAQVVPTLRDAPGERVLLTNEDLCEADPARIEALADVADRAGLELQVVLTLRGLAAVIPSEWQQYLKHRMTLDYPTFLERVRDRRGRWARHFWLRQDPVAIVERWAAVAGADQVDVVVTPDRSVDPTGLYRMMAEVIGFDVEALRWPDRDVNASFGYVESEVYRRLNEALDGRLRRYEREYQPAVRWPLVQGVLPRSASARVPLPPEHLPWVQELAIAHVAGLRDSGVRLHGDPDRLVPGDDAARELPEVSEADVAAAAVATLANFAVFTHRREQRRGAGRRRHPEPGHAGRGALAWRRLRGRG